MDRYNHLLLDKAYSEIARVLKPGGKALCSETLGHNPAIHLYRKMTPKLRTPWEVDHILKKPQIELAKNYFETVDVRLFHIATLLAVPFRKQSFFPKVLSALETVDDALLKIPFVKWNAWQVVFTLSNPKKNK